MSLLDRDFNGKKKIVCPQCGEEKELWGPYKHKSSNKYYICKKCGKTFSYPYYKNCVICGKRFHPTNSQICCSRNCMIVHKKRYKKKYNHEHRIERQIKQNVRFREMRVKLILILGGKCVRCGYNDFRALEIDHINGGGRADQEVHGGNSKMYRHYIKNIKVAREKLQVLCSNCNSIKRYEQREHSTQIDIIEISKRLSIQQMQEEYTPEYRVIP